MVSVKKSEWHEIIIIFVQACGCGRVWDDESVRLQLEGESLVKETGSPGCKSSRERQQCCNLANCLADEHQPDTDHHIRQNY